jgi:hypothetical protein
MSWAAGGCRRLGAAGETGGGQWRGDDRRWVVPEGAKPLGRCCNDTTSRVAPLHYHQSRDRASQQSNSRWWVVSGSAIGRPNNQIAYDGLFLLHHRINNLIHLLSPLVNILVLSSCMNTVIALVDLIQSQRCGQHHLASAAMSL